MTKPKPKKRYATLKFRDKVHNGRLVSIEEGASDIYLLIAGGVDTVVLAEFVEGADKGKTIAVRTSNFAWCKS